MSATDVAPKRTSRSSLENWVRFLAWPIAFLVVLAMFRDPLSDLIRRTTKVEVKKDEKAITVAVIAANLGAAEATRPDTKSSAKTPVDLEGVATAATRAAGSLALSQAKILWVDDNPDNNRYERNGLGALGVQFQLATNTEEALKLLNSKRFSLVISDFGRRDDPQAGYTLLDQVKKLSSPPPFIIYGSSADPQHEKDARSRGAYGQTNSPQRLFDLAVSALAGK
jgi:CheY-like chemotaxis protein